MTCSISIKRLILLIVLTSAASGFFAFQLANILHDQQQAETEKITSQDVKKHIEAPSSAVIRFMETAADKLPLLYDKGNMEHLVKALEASRQHLSEMPSDRLLSFGDEKITVSRINSSVEALLHLLKMRQDEPVWLQNKTRRMFKLYEAVLINGKEQPSEASTLVTGYFQPLLQASLYKTGEFTYPLYSKPKDLVQAKIKRLDASLPDKTLWGKVENGSLVPYLSRYEIDYSQITNKDFKALAWLASPIDALMLQIQGSGILSFPDGTRRFIHYAASNGRPYGSIGKWLIKHGYIKQQDADWPSIRQWCMKHPDKLKEAAKANPRYIFFQWEPQGPIGSMGAVLQPMRSVALDNSVFPEGALYFLTFELPNAKSKRNFAGFVLNQDKGNAIKGANRVDLYCGAGEKAGQLAGRLKNRGKIYLMLLR